MKTLLSVLISILAFQAQCAISIDASRVIYSGKDKSASLRINNPTSQNYIVQSWLDTGNGSASTKLPMVVTPPLVKLRPDQSAQLRFIYSGSGLPTDRETLYWVNVQEIPPAAEGKNILQFAIRTRLKLFYRPQRIKNSLPEEVRKLRWDKRGTELSFKNDGPLHITLVKIEAKDNKGKSYLLDSVLVPPFNTASVTIPQNAYLNSFKYMNDYGAAVNIPVNK
ncbi:TPA: molecular chaperone [Citrobacter freundii]